VARPVLSAVATARRMAPHAARLVAMGAKSRQIMEREFAWSVLVAQYIRQYRELLTAPVGENR
jgi:hypothetical protein